MRLPNDPTKFSSSFKFVEAAFYIPPSEEYPKAKLARRLKYKDGPPRLFTIEAVQSMAEKFNNEGIYTSVFQYNNEEFDQASFMSSLYFDLDSEDLHESLTDCYKLYNHLKNIVPTDSIRVYFSGGKGFHVECEALTLNTGTSEDVSNIFNFIARTLKEELSLSTIDLKVYDIRRVWRLPNSRHQKTGLFKIPCKDMIEDGLSIDEIMEAAKNQRFEEIPEAEFDPVANSWYREFVYKFEQDKLNSSKHQQDLLSRFLEQGSGSVHSFTEYEKVFDQYKLFKSCPAVRRLVNRANTEHHLDHYERLFLCSLLTYTQDAIEFLHEILSQCSDYHFEITNSHIQDWIKRREYGIGGRPFTCEKAKQVGITCTGCDGLEPKKKIHQLGDKRYIETDEFSNPSPVRNAYTILKGIKNER